MMATSCGLMTLVLKLPNGLINGSSWIGASYLVAGAGKAAIPTCRPVTSVVVPEGTPIDLKVCWICSCSAK